MVNDAADFPGPDVGPRWDRERYGRVLLLMENDANHAILAEWLAGAADLLDAQDVEADPANVDLCIVDEGGFELAMPVVSRVREAAAPTFVPILLVCTRRPATIGARYPEGVDPIVWDAVDEVIQTPVSKAEFGRRLAVLVRVRRQAVELEAYADRLAFVHSLLRHEILNAMAVIQPRAGELEAHLEGGDREYAATIYRWSREITDLVQRLSTLIASIVADRNAATLVATDLRPEVLAIGDRFAETFPEVSFSVAAEPATVAVDDVIRDVLGNLVHNAVEHNDAAHPTVDVSLSVLDDHATFVVADNGPGIPENRRATVFRRRTEDLLSQTEGDGFGLFFVDTKVTQYGGTVRVEDNVPCGTRMVVSLPLVVDADPSRVASGA